MKKYKTFCILTITVIITSCLFIQTIYAAIAGHTIDEDSVDGSKIRYGGTTKYDLSYAILKWNELSKIEILGDSAFAWQDLTISDVNKPNELWSGVWTYVPLFADQIQYNTAVMDNRSENKISMNRKTVMHELGHALGIDDHGFSYSNIVMYGDANTQDTLTDHDIEDYNLAN